MANTNTDKFVNLLTDTVTMSAANTITFKEINIGLNIFDKVGLLLTRIEYDPAAASLQDLDTDGDYLVMGITSSQTIATLSMLNQEVIDQTSLLRLDAGAAANYNIFARPFVHDFSTMPGGGLLIPPKPLYVAASSGGMTVAAVLYVRLYFIIYKLNDSEYLELLETRRAFG